MTPKEKQILSAIAAVAILAGGYVWATKYRKAPEPNPQPQNSQSDKTRGVFRNIVEGFEYTYPYPATKYVHADPWPPSVALTSGSGIEGCPAKSIKTINGRKYCVTVDGGGAAGTFYSQYQYLTAINGRSVVIAFTLATTNCGVYDEPNFSACEKEQSGYDIDQVIDGILSTFKFTK